MTPTEALGIIRQKITLPKGVTARIDPKQKEAVLVGTLDLVFAVAGPSLAYDEEYLIHRINQSLRDLEKVIPEYEEQKAVKIAAAALVESQKRKRKK